MKNFDRFAKLSLGIFIRKDRYVNTPFLLPSDYDGISQIRIFLNGTEGFSPTRDLFNETSANKTCNDRRPGMYLG